MPATEKPHSRFFDIVLPSGGRNRRTGRVCLTSANNDPLGRELLTMMRQILPALLWILAGIGAALVTVIVVYIVTPLPSAIG